MSGALVPKPMLGRQLRVGHPLARGLVGYWLLNEGSGDKVFDLSGNGCDLTGVNSPTWVAGKFGSATRYVAASTQYFSRDCSPVTVLPYTVCCWVKAGEDNPSSLRTFFFYGSTSDDADYFEISFNTSGQIAARNRHTSAGFAVSGDVADGKFHQACVVIYNPTSLDIDLYVDGVFEDQVLSSATDITNTYGRVALGMLRRPSPIQAFEGDIGYTVIWNRALSASEIALLYREPFRMFERDPIELWAAATAGAAPGVTMAAPYYRHLMQGVV